jgi:outer membrane protein assembly factor BamA
VLVTANLIDFRFPLFWWFNGALFADAGYVWQDPEDIRDFAQVIRDVRWTAGPGLRINTPIAVIRFDVGFKLDWVRGSEDLWAFHFDIGQPF